LATYIASDLNHLLPEGYFAEPNVQFGIEIDVATFEDSLAEEIDDLYENASPQNSLKWKPPAPTKTFPFQPVSERVKINIFNNMDWRVSALGPLRNEDLITCQTKLAINAKIMYHTCP